MTKQAGLNITLLKEKSNVLQNLLKRYSVNEEDASTSLKELQPIFDLIAKDQIASPYTNPG